MSTATPAITTTEEPKETPAYIYPIAGFAFIILGLGLLVLYRWWHQKKNPPSEEQMPSNVRGSTTIQRNGFPPDPLDEMPRHITSFITKLTEEELEGKEMSSAADYFLSRCFRPETKLEIYGEYGSGCSGIVLKARQMSHCKPEEVAVKCLKTFNTKLNGELTEKSEAEFRSLMLEGETVLKLNCNEPHPNIVQCIGFYIVGERNFGDEYNNPFANDCPGLIMEVLTPLKDHICKNLGTQNMSKESAQDRKVGYAFQIASAMAFLHGREPPLLHRDLALRNMLYREQNDAVKISDFGLSRSGDFYQYAHRRKLPINWMAPETFKEHTYYKSSDVWSFGCTFWEILTDGKYRPYGEIAHSIELIVSGELPAQQNDIRSKYFDVIRSCWEYHPHDRPTFATLEDTLDHMAATCKDYLAISAPNFNDIRVHNRPTRKTSAKKNKPELPKRPSLLIAITNDGQRVPKSETADL